MSKILIFGGTTEGRRLAQIFAKNGIETELCVASEYGEKLMEFSDFEELTANENSLLKIKTGRISKSEMENLCNASFRGGGNRLYTAGFSGGNSCNQAGARIVACR